MTIKGVTSIRMKKGYITLKGLLLLLLPSLYIPIVVYRDRGAAFNVLSDHMNHASRAGHRGYGKDDRITRSSLKTILRGHRPYDHPRAGYPYTPFRWCYQHGPHRQHNEHRRGDPHIIANRPCGPGHNMGPRLLSGSAWPYGPCRAVGTGGA